MELTREKFIIYVDNKLYMSLLIMFIKFFVLQISYHHPWYLTSRV